MFKLAFWRNAAIVSTLAAVSYFQASAADVNARIKGTVTDPAGALIANAAITATNQATGVTFTTTSQADGGYIFQQLPVGTYTVKVSAPGFKEFQATGIILNIDQEYVESAKLSVGSTSDVVEIHANAVQVNTTDMQLSNVVTSAQMVELPLIGRNFTGLELTLPGVQAPSDRFGTLSVSGSQTQQSEYLINGADSNDISLNTLAIVPNLDAIDQFNLIDGPLNAEYDRNSGGIVSATIKQGSNKFHGDLFEFYRDTFLNTLNFFQKAYNPATGRYSGTVTPYHQNIFGGTLGGPIIKDKLFFFGAYQGIHQRVPDNSPDSVFSAANLTGDFSADNPAIKGARPVLNTATGVYSDWGDFSGQTTIPSTIAIAGCTAGEAWSDCGYDLNGVIPTSNLSKLATTLAGKYIPAANSQTYGYVFNGTTATSSNQYIGRIDYALNSKNQFTVLGIFSKGTTTDTLPFTGATLPGFGDQDITTVQQYTFDYVRQISATTVNDFALHWTRFNYQAVIPQNIVTPTSLGFSITPQDAAAASVPTIAVGGNNTSFTLGFSTNGPQPRIDQVYQIDENLSKTIGHHTLKFGYDGRRFNVSNPFSANNSGDFNFLSTTSSPNNSYSTGDGGLDFLLGNPGGYGQGSGASIQADAFLNYLYAQDTWKMSNTFTLSYGLGYSIDTPLQNHQYGGEGIACLIPGEQSTVFANAPTGLVYPGDPGCTNSGQSYTRYSEFGPRLGFAWAPDLGVISGAPGKFSIRGGFGIYYDRSEEETALQTLETPPFGTNTGGAADFGGVPQFANPFADINGGQGLSQASEVNKFPFIFPTKGQAISPSTYNPLFYLSTYGPSFRAPYAENIQLSMEREFAARTIVRLSYVGSMARHNQMTYEGNYETAAGQAACAASATCIADRNLQPLDFPQNTIAGAIYAPTGQPGFTSVGEVGSESSSSYHSLQAHVEKAMTHNLTFQLSYTYAHALDNGSSFENSGFGENGSRGYNQYDQALNYGDSAYDVRHRLVFSPIYSTPLLHGSAFAPLNLAVSGWEISGIVTLATGFPYDISYAGGTSRSLYCADEVNYYACPDVPMQTGPLVRSNPRARSTANGNSTWFSGSSFAPENIGTFGNIHRDPYHGPGINNTNMILAKNFILSQDGVIRLQLRMESDNVFNHAQFANPTSTYGSGTFGEVTAVNTTNPSRQSQLAVKVYF